MSIYGIRRAIQTVEKELNELDYSRNKEEIRKHGSNVFILTENIVKELVYIYGYLIYGDDYKKQLYKFKNFNKIMFGNALYILKELGNRVKYNNKDILHDLNRDYLVFDINDNTFEKLINCSRIRGGIIHEHGLEVDDLEEYKRQVREGIKLSFDALKELKEKNIFPDIVEFDSIVSDREGEIIYFKDEINSKVPFKVINEELQYIKNTQWYIFRNTNVKNPIAVRNKIDILNDDTIEPKIICGIINSNIHKEKFGYLEIVGRDKIEINKPKIFVGRLVTNDIQLTNRSVSRRHCLIETIDKYAYVVDLDSKFGTYLNDIKLIPRERVLIYENDEISIGKGIEMVKIRYMK